MSRRVSKPDDPVAWALTQTLFCNKGPMGIIILDGGLGTALEAELGPSIGQSALWSTQAVIDHPSAVLKAHTAFLAAGAMIIETATYQAALQTFVASGQSHDGAQRTMLKAVELARQAKVGGKAFVALSLGPFGATLRPTQEFLGYYPPPYGPQAYSETGNNTCTFKHPKDEVQAVDALARFHLDRLLVYSSDTAIWDAIDYLAFETVLLEREVIAIRKAMKLFIEGLCQSGQAFSKLWWVTFVASGNEMTAGRGDMEALARAALSEELELPLPCGVGINCTPLQQLPSLLTQLSKVVAPSPSPNVILVVYPNGGDYDTDNQCWKPNTDGNCERWAIWFANLLRDLAREGRWKHIIAGGCCRTDPTHIKMLRQITKGEL